MRCPVLTKVRSQEVIEKPELKREQAKGKSIPQSVVCAVWDWRSVFAIALCVRCAMPGTEILYAAASLKVISWNVTTLRRWGYQLSQQEPGLSPYGKGMRCPVLTYKANVGDAQGAFR
eukprot:27580-Rhodomonas_salina.2